MASLMTIPIPCWVCGESFDSPAQITILPPRYMPENWLGQPVDPLNAKVWLYVDKGPIREHVRAHERGLILLFSWWLAFVQVTGIDPLRYYANR